MRMPNIAFCGGILLLLLSLVMPGTAGARPDIPALYVDALLGGDVEALDKLLAPNFVSIAGNGHIKDREHFLEDIRNGSSKLKDITFENLRETTIGSTRVITGNGTLLGTSSRRNRGLMRMTMVTDASSSAERIVLVQVTPVVPSRECKDGNCKIR